MFRKISLLLHLWLVLDVTGGDMDMKAKVIPAAYVKEVHNVVTYHNSIPQFFKIEMPPLPADAESELFKCRGDGLKCSLINDLTKIFSSARQDRLNYEPAQGYIQENNDGKVKRQLGAILGFFGGLALGPIVTKIKKAIFGSDDEVTALVNKLRDSVDASAKHIFNLEEGLHNLSAVTSRKIEQIEHIITDKVEAIVYQDFMLLLGLLVEKNTADSIHASITSCQQRIIPSAILPTEALYGKLSELEQKILPNGYKLAIPTSRISEYLKLPIADCMFSNSSAYIIANIPIVKITNSVTRLFEIIHSKFAYNGQTCDLYPQEVSYLAISGSRSVLLNNHILQHCSVHEHQLCYIPPYSKETSQSLQCAVGLYQEKSIEELEKVCTFRCVSGSELSINQVDQSTLLITNAEEIVVECAHKPKSKYSFPSKLGAVELKLSCNCTATIDKSEVVETPFPCWTVDWDDLIHHQITHVIPNMWSNATKLVDSYFSNHSSSYIDEIISDDWTSSIPVWNFTALPAIKVPSYLSSGTPVEYYFVYFNSTVAISTTLYAISRLVHCFICWCKRRT